MRRRATTKSARQRALSIFLESLEDRVVLAAVIPGFDSTVFPGSDDGVQGPIDIGFDINFLGSTFSQLFVNNNGNVTFGSSSSQFTPTALTNSNQLPRIAAFFADIDTRSGNTATYGTGMVDGHQAFGVNWPGVGYYNTHTDKTNKFQLLLIDRSDRGTNDFDIEFNYDQIQWETGDASGGSGGLGGTAARLGYTNGSGNAGTYFELSGRSGSFLDSSISTGLIHQHFNSDVDGRFVFLVHAGEVISSPLPFNLSVSGAINATNPSNDWTFFGRTNQSVTINVHTGTLGSPPSPLTPTLNFAQVQLIDQAGVVVATASNTDSGTDVSLAGITLPSDGTYRIRVTASPDHATAVGNYTILTGDATVHTSSLELNQTTYGQIFSPFAVDRWTFTGTANQQLQFNLIASQSPGIQFDLMGPGGATLFNNISASSDLLNLPSNGQYVLTAHSGNGQSGAYAFSINQVAVTPLTLDTPYNGAILSAGQLQLFKVDITDGNPLLVQFNDASNSNTNEVYIRRGAPPTRGVYDYRSTAVTSDQNVQVPFASPGTWYILVYTRSSASPSTFSLLAKTNPIFLNDVSPDSYAAGQVVDVTLSGSGFLPGTSVDLLGPGNTIVASAQAVQINSFSQLTATFDLAGVAVGTYGVRATLPSNSSATLASAFHVLTTGQGHLETNIILPGVVGRHAIATIYVEYANTGNVALPAPILTLQSADPDGSDMPLLTLDQTRLTEGFWTSSLPDGFSHSIQIYASGAVPGVLLPGERIRVPVYYAGLEQPWDFGDNNVEFEIKVHDAGSTDVIDWAALKPVLKPDWIPATAWDAIFNNLVTQIGPTYGDYVNMLSTDARYLGQLGESVTAVSKLFSFELQQAIGLSPVSSLASMVDANVAAPGLSLAFAHAFGDNLIQRYQMGPFGIGWSASWQYTFSVRADGTVTIQDSSGSQRTFQPDSRTAGAYFSQTGDSGILVKKNDGAFELTETNGQVTRFRADQTLEYVQDINGNRITAGFTSGRLTSLIHSSGASIQLTYNVAGRITSLTSFAGVTDLTGRVTTYAYDATNTYLLSVTGPAGTTSYTYDTGSDPAKRNALLSITDPNGISQLFEYDSFGRLSSTHLAGDVQRVNYTYSVGAYTATDGAGVTTTTFTDADGLVVRTQDGLGNYTNFLYNNLRQLIRVTDALGHSVEITRCDCNQPTSITDQLGNITKFGLGGPNNATTSLKDANGNVTQFHYDTAGNQDGTTYADGSVESEVFNALGDALSLVNRRGQVVSLTRNAAGQVTQESFPDNSSNTYTYDTRGRLAMAVDAHGTTLFTYDSSDRLTRVDYPAGRFIQYAYDASGRRTSMEDSTGFKLHYIYDAAGRLSELKQVIGNTETRIDLYTFDAAGRLAREDKGNGTFTVYTYDGAGRLTSIVNHAADSSVNSQFIYSYDALNRRTSMTTTDGTWTYEFDLTGQLTHAVFASTNQQIPNQNLSYVYDALGNRVRTIINGATTDYSSNTLNQYTTVGDTSYTYDADGNLISEAGPDGTRQYTYDALNRLVQLVTPQGTWQYEYDAFGNRVATVVDNVRTEYLLDPANQTNIVSAFDGAGNLTASYAFGLTLTATVQAGGTGYYDLDGIGSVTGISGSVGTYTGAGITAQYAYDPFGSALLNVSSFANPFQYVGGAGVTTDGSGLASMRARSYDFDLGRFTTIDPLRIGGFDTNYYRYVGNDPLDAIDPSGLRICYYGPFGENPFVNGGPNDFVGFSLGTSVGSSVGISSGVSAGASASVGFGASEGIGPSFFVGPSVEAGANAGVASAGVAGAGLGIHGGVGVGASADVIAIGSSTGASVGAGLGYSHGSTYGFIFGFGDCPEPPPPPPPQPPTPPGGTGTTGSSGTVQSQDPNDLIGPAGIGPQNFVSANSVFPYRIDFENASTASAPAQRVVITNQLSSDLDWSTFEFTDFGFGDTNLIAPPNSQHYEQTVFVTQNNTTFNVLLVADLNAATGLVTISFQSIDPDTQLPPDVLTGFLPPEDGTGRGQGHASYIIRPVASALPGTEIRNVALIQFDANTVIATNQVDEHDPSQGTDPNKEALVTLAASNQTLRKHGENVELVDDSGQVLFSQPLTSTTPIVLHGIDGVNSDFTVDFVFGGVFDVPGGVQYVGGNLGHDQIIVKGDLNLALTNSSVTSSGLKSPIAFSGVNRARLVGGSSKNTLDASKFSGNATLEGGGGGGDVLIGGVGNDTFVVGAGKSKVTGGGGQDTVELQASGIITLQTKKLVWGAGSVTLKEVENAVLTGGAGADVFNVSGWSGHATLDGGGGTDRVLSTNDANFTLTDTLLTRSTGGTFNLVSIESADLIGGKGNNMLDASAFTGFTYLNGSTGNDILKSGKGGSILIGGKGNDQLLGNVGRDVLFAGVGSDNLNGGDGQDILFGKPVTFEAKRSLVDALFSTWNNSVANFQTRVTQLKAGTAGLPKLDAAALKGEKLPDVLTGGLDLDWFFAKQGQDTVNDFTADSDVLTPLT